MTKNLILSQLQELNVKTLEAFNAKDFDKSATLVAQYDFLLQKLDNQLSNKQETLEKLISSILKSISSNKSLNDKMKLELSSSITSDVIRALLDNQS